MAFWGIEVKPGNPFTHKFDDSKGRLHVSMASLGLGSAVSKSLLQCNVGNKSPLFLCSLYPEKSESLQLNLEFEEVDDVVFSVIGPRSIHISGYYLGGGRHRSLDADSESYGEDIADTDTQRSDCSEDDYEDSFIDDDDLETFPTPPIFCSGEEHLDDNKRHGKSNRRRRLRKTYQLSDSDNEGCPPQKRNSNHSTVLASDDDDNCTISSFLKTGVSAKECMQKGENADKETDEASEKNAKNYGNSDTVSKPNADDPVEGGRPVRLSNLSVDGMPLSEANDKKVLTPRKKRKERSISDAKGHKTQLSELKVDTEINAEQGQVPNFSDDTNQARENNEKPKMKRKVDDAKEESMRGENKIKKKKKNAEKVKENEEAVNMEMPPKQIGETNTSSIVAESNVTLQARTLQNGLVIEVLESGKPDGKVALPGKKVSIRYVGKLRKTGKVIDSIADHNVFKFRLGSGKVIDGWEVGLEGMQVGERRRVTIPPIMGYGDEGDGKNVPPKSWLVYEFQLVKVR